MTYVITDRCIGTKDGACVEVCPVDCIIDIGEMMVIDPIVCIDCGACEPECPVEAIKPDVEVEGTDDEKWIEHNARALLELRK